MSGALACILLLVAALTAAPRASAFTTLQVICPEPNDNPTESCPIELPGSIQQQIATADDVDAYVFRLETAATVQAALTDLPDDYDLYLVNASGEVVAEARAEGLADDRLRVSVAEPGDYLLYVSSGRGGFNADRPYTLSVEATDLAGNSIEAAPLAASPFAAQEESARIVRQPARKAYLSSNKSPGVTVLDLQTLAVSGTIETGTTAGHMVLSRDAGQLFVIGGDNYPVAVIDTASDTVIKNVSVASGAASGAISPDGRRLYVACYLAQAVTIVELPALSVSGVVQGFNTPWGVAVSPDSSRLAVTQYWDNSVLIMDTSSRSAVTRVPVGEHPEGADFNPAGTRLYVANNSQGTGALSGSVTVIDTANWSVVADIPVRTPARIAVNQSGSKVYVSSASPLAILSEIDTATNQVGRSFTAGSLSVGLAVTTDGSRAYFTGERSGSLSMVDLSAGRVTTLPGLPAPVSVAILE